MVFPRLSQFHNRKSFDLGTQWILDKLTKFVTLKDRDMESIEWGWTVNKNLLSRQLWNAYRESMLPVLWFLLGLLCLHARHTAVRKTTVYVYEWDLSAVLSFCSLLDSIHSWYSHICCMIYAYSDFLSKLLKDYHRMSQVFVFHY
jgi:hypothetical protein